MTNKRKGGLGRGMDALFGNLEERPADHEVVEEIALSEIRPNPYQPRKHFDDQALAELADSIKQSGVFQPVILRKSAIKGYELIAGERRVRASQIAGRKTIPAIVRQIDEKAMIEIAVVENLQREDLNALEEAEAYETLMDKLNLTQSEVADRMGKSRSYIANYLRLLQLPDPVKQLVVSGDLSMGQARTLLGLQDKSAMTDLAKKVVSDQMTVRQLEEYVQLANQSGVSNHKKRPKPKAKKGKSPQLIAMESELEDYFGTTTRIKPQGDHGKIEIEYMSESDLIRIMDLLKIQL